MMEFQVGEEVSYLIPNNFTGIVVCVDYDYTKVRWKASGKTTWESNKRLISMMEKVILT